jgi:hypothetical protein
MAGLRLHALTSPGRSRAMTAFLLLMPGIPMLFQGQEFAASNPFLYFADHNAELDRAVRKGRREFLGQFPAWRTPKRAIGSPIRATSSLSPFGARPGRAAGSCDRLGIASRSVGLAP